MMPAQNPLVGLFMSVLFFLVIRHAVWGIPRGFDPFTANFNFMIRPLKKKKKKKYSHFQAHPPLSIKSYKILLKYNTDFPVKKKKKKILRCVMQCEHIMTHTVSACRNVLCSTRFSAGFFCVLRRTHRQFNIIYRSWMKTVFSYLNLYKKKPLNKKSIP